jgi:iron complex outermembrane receptor protein
VSNFVYGRLGGDVCSEGGDPFDVAVCTGEALRERSFDQASATIRGYEIDASYNLYEYGWFSRAFADDSRGTLDNLGSLPLQPVKRVGATIGYQDANWLSSLFILNASSQNRLATSPVYQDEDGTTEKVTRGYTRVDANISWRQRIGENELTWFASARNLLNEEIRLSTSLLKDYVPQPGRNFIVGVRARF